jgi:hypothetical protein
MVFSAKERAVAAEKAREDLYFYSRWMMLQRRRIQWIRGAHHPVVCAALMRVFQGLCLRLIINMPPRYSKTELVKNFMGYGLGHYPDSEFMYLSYSSTLAADKTADLLLDVQQEAYHEIFPAVELASTGQGHWKTTAGGVVYASGTSGTVTGFGAGKMREGFGGCLIVDDAHKPDEVFSPTIREGVIRNFQNTVENRLNWAHTPIVVIAHCLHEEDLIAWLLAGNNGEKWERVCLPAINADGTALWPGKHSIERLRAMQKAAPYTFSGQYLQAAVPVGGAFFSQDHLLIRRETEILHAPGILESIQPEAVYDPVEMPAVLKAVYAVIDTANKAGVAHDGLGVVYFGLRPPDVVGLGRLVILDYDLTQIDAAFLIDWMPGVFKTLEDLSRECRALQGSVGAWIEDKGSGIVLLQQCTNKGWDVHPVDSKFTAIGKTPRCINVSGYVQGGEVKMARRAYERIVEYKGQSRNHLLSQILRFSPAVADQGADDLLDCFSAGTSIGLGNADSF